MSFLRGAIFGVNIFVALFGCVLHDASMTVLASGFILLSVVGEILTPKLDSDKKCKP